MEIIENKEVVVFRKEFEGKVSYSLGLSRKNQEGNFDRGYIPVRFRNGVELKDRARIRINKAWLDFFKVDKRTIPYIFINEFEEAQPTFSDIKGADKIQYAPEEKAIDKIPSAKEIIADDNLPFY